MSDLLISRLKAYRLERDINQQKLADAMGLPKRQSLTDIEGGRRKLKPEELLKAIEVFGVTMDEFLDPTSLIGRASFSWRQNEAQKELIEEVKAHASHLIGLYEFLQAKQGHATDEFRKTLPLNESSTIDEAKACAERIVAKSELGEYPARQLPQLLAKLKVERLFLDLPENVSAAAINLADHRYIVINRNEVPGRRNFNEAHELFHLLTWDALPPHPIDPIYSNRQERKPKAEKLADAFAEALLMPQQSVTRHVERYSGEIDAQFINNIADRFEVSGTAMLYRLRRLNFMTQAQVDTFDLETLRFNGAEAISKPKLLNDTVVQCFHQGLIDGDTSVRKVAKALEMDFDQLTNLFEQYNLKTPFDL